MGRRLSVYQKASMLGDAIFAASDGLITTFAIVAGSTGASLANDVVLVLGFANLFADGFSMASGNYLGSKSEIEYEKARGKGTDTLSPLNHGIITFVAFNIAGFVPLVPYVFNLPEKFLLSVILVGSSMFVIGLSRAKYLKRSLLGSGLEMLVIGGIAASIAFGVGYLVERIVG